MQRIAPSVSLISVLLACSLAAGADPSPSLSTPDAAPLRAVEAPATGGVDLGFPAPVKAVPAEPGTQPSLRVPVRASAQPVDLPLFQDDEEFPVGVLGGPANFEMDWFTVDGGGTTFAQGGNFELAGTTGQADAGVSVGGGYTLTGGFWGRVRMDECPGDADGNGIVNFADITAVLANWGDFGATGDANNDWFVSFADIVTVLSYFNVPCP